MSAVEQTLRHDPEGSYVKMDFVTRDHYRHVIEKIAKKSPFAEEEVAKNAIILAQQSSKTNGDVHRTAHVGYYLIDKGLPELEKTVRVRGTIQKTFRNLGKTV